MTEPTPTPTPTPTPAPAPAPTPAPTPQPEPKSEPEPEPKQANPYQSIIDQQNEQIQTLMEYNAKLSAQITQMVQNGAQFTQQTQPQPKPAPVPSLSDDQDYSLESLAKEIGKRG